jgi:hypothetical protein
MIMGSLSKGLALVLILTVTFSTLSLIIVKPVNAQSSTPAPSIPIPSVPQFTLKLVNNEVQIIVQNQPTINDGYNSSDIFYAIRVKSHASDNWVNTTNPNPSQDVRGYIEEFGTSGHMLIVMSFDSFNSLIGLSNGSLKIDFQIEAINGYLNNSLSQIENRLSNNTPVIIVNTSDWSSTQTITIPSSSLSPTSTIRVSCHDNSAFASFNVRRCCDS